MHFQKNQKLVKKNKRCKYEDDTKFNRMWRLIRGLDLIPIIFYYTINICLAYKLLEHMSWGHIFGNNNKHNPEKEENKKDSLQSSSFDLKSSSIFSNKNSWSQDFDDGVSPILNHHNEIHARPKENIRVGSMFDATTGQTHLSKGHATIWGNSKGGVEYAPIKHFQGTQKIMMRKKRNPVYKPDKSVVVTTVQNRLLEQEDPLINYQKTSNVIVDQKNNLTKTNNNNLDKNLGLIPIHNSYSYLHNDRLPIHSFFRRSEEELLYEKLFHDYHKDLRPVSNSSKALIVSVDVVLQRILALEDSEQILIASIWIRLKWHDMFLTWNPEKYGGIRKMLVPADRLWLPDIVLYNNVDKDLFERTLTTNVRINYLGDIEWDSPQIVKAACRLNVATFPFDKQTCNLVFGSWTYDSRQLIIKRERPHANVTAYEESSHWTLLMPVKATIHETKYACCDWPFINLTYTINIERKPTYYFVNLITPCVLVSILAPLSFTVPIESSSRVHMSLSLFLSVTMFLVLLTRVIPAAEDVSIISIYYVGSMTVMAGSSILCIFTVGLQQQGQIIGDIPNWMEYIFLKKIAGFVLLDVPDFVKINLETLKKICRKKAEGTSTVFLSTKTVSDNYVIQELVKCLESIRSTRQELQSTTQMTLVKNRWGLITQCLDRIFALVFICITSMTIYWCLVASRC